MNRTGAAEASTATATIVSTAAAPVTRTGASDSSTDRKVIAAYVCFGVGAFIIVIAVLIIIVFLVRRRRRSKQKEQIHCSSISLDEYKLPGTGNRISTISASEHVSKIDVPDYNFTGNGYRFPLATMTGNNGLAQRHPLDDETSLPVALSAFSPQSTDSNSPYPSRSSGEVSTESHLAETEGYVRLHRSSPLAGINAIYSSSGELSQDYEITSQKTTSSESRDRTSVGSRRSSLKRANMIEKARNFGKQSRVIGLVNEGFISEDYYATPKVLRGNSSLRTSLERSNKDHIPSSKSHSSRKSSVLLDNVHMHNGVYHVSLRHNGSSVTQTSVVKHPT